MILSAFRLERDRNTENDTFGYERSMWSKYDRVSGYPLLGCPIINTTPLRTNIVKIIEHHLTKEEVPVVIERLAWYHDGNLYPYRAKYIRPATKDHQDKPILFLANMKWIHKSLSGINVTFVTPFQYCLDTMMLNRQGSPMWWYLTSVYNQHREYMSGFSEQESDLTGLQEFIMATDAGNMYQDVRPLVCPLPMTDPLSVLFAARPVRAADIGIYGATRNPFDTSSVSSIVINYPEVTVYSPASYHIVARMCDQLSYQYSDVKINYILSGCKILENQVVKLVSRYLDATDDVHSYCKRIIEEAVSIIDKTSPALSHWHHQMMVRFELTYGEEVMIEVYTIDQKQCLLAIHLDLAMIALCSPGVIATPT